MKERRPMNRPPEPQETYYYPATTDLQPAYYSAVEERCEHLEELTYSTLELLQEVIKDFHSPSLKPLLGALVERLYSITALMETELATLRSLDVHQ
jgi:hypothetical protein